MKKCEYLGKIFDPSVFTIYTSTELDSDIDKQLEIIKEKQEFDKEAYLEIIKGLENDMISLGMNLTYSSKILIGQIASNILQLNKIKFDFINKSLIMDVKKLKPEHIVIKKDSYSNNRLNKIINYGNEYQGEDVHPIFIKLVPLLNKQINNGLKSLGLLPSQQIERQKLLIVKKLRQRLLNIEKNGNKLEVDAVVEEKI